MIADGSTVAIGGLVDERRADGVRAGRWPGAGRAT